MIVIAIPGFVYRKGLELLFKELSVQQKLFTTGDLKEFSRLLEDNNPNLLYIHESFLPSLNFQKLQSLNLRIVKVFNNKPVNSTDDGFNAEILYLDDDENQVIKNIKRNISLSERPAEDEEDESEISEREKDILREIALGKTNKEIADSLFISAHTVITHRKNITRKLGIKSVSGLTVYAILNKIIQMEEL